MNLVGILLIVIGVGCLAVIVLGAVVKHLREDKKILEKRLSSMSKNVAQLKTGFNDTAEAEALKGEIDEMIKGAKDEDDAKATRDRIVNHILSGLRNRPNL